MKYSLCISLLLQVILSACGGSKGGGSQPVNGTEGQKTQSSTKKDHQDQNSGSGTNMRKPPYKPPQVVARVQVTYFPQRTKDKMVRQMVMTVRVEAKQFQESMLS